MIYFAAVRKKKDLVATFRALRRMADIFVVFNDEETSLNLFNTALEGATQIDIHGLRAECMVGIGNIMRCRGKMVEAMQMWEAAHPLLVRSSQKKAANAIKAQIEKLSSAEDNQEDILESAELDRKARATANQEEDKKLEQLVLLSVPQNSLLTVMEGSMQPTLANGPESNATGKLNCTIQDFFRS
jgi:hypothetical protein